MYFAVRFPCCSKINARNANITTVYYLMGKNRCECWTSVLHSFPHRFYPIDRKWQLLFDLTRTFQPEWVQWFEIVHSTIESAFYEFSNFFISFSYDSFTKCVLWILTKVTDYNWVLHGPYTCKPWRVARRVPLTWVSSMIFCCGSSRFLRAPSNYSQLEAMIKMIEFNRSDEVECERIQQYSVRLNFACHTWRWRWRCDEQSEFKKSFLMLSSSLILLFSISRTGEKENTHSNGSKHSLTNSFWVCGRLIQSTNLSFN